MALEDFTAEALNLATTKGAQYADIRTLERRSESISVKNGNVEAMSLSEDEGFGVRVLVDGAWGFASSSQLSKDEINRVTALAIQIAHASARTVTKRVELGAPIVVKDSYRTPVERDPFEVPLEEKLKLLLAADEAMRRVKGVMVAQGSYDALKTHKIFASTEGSYIEQDIYEIGSGIEATAVSENDVQVRSYPNSAGGQWGTRGYELVTALDLPGHAEQTASEAVQLLSAKQCPAGRTTIILCSSQLALQIHESCGHPIELDRVFGQEAAFAGTSFLTTEKLGNFHYGSELVNIFADATVPGGLGTFGWDDEGIPAQRVPNMDKVVLVGYLTNRETAAEIGRTSGGAARAYSWNHIPIIRMTNINIEPGDSSLEQMIAETDDGIYFGTNRSWSIDDKRYNFQFGTEAAWEIKNGKLGQMLKNATYTGITPKFWGSLDALGNRDEWICWGLPNCGKGQPMQIGHVGHGAPPGRFRNVEVGIVK
jgi:TldD protein